MSPRRSDLKNKAATRGKILASAQKLLRTQGVSGTSVEKVMSGAGLTVGGFYAHFRSKECLVAESLRSAFDQGRETMRQALSSLDRRWLAKYACAYLSSAHRGNPESGCPIPALLSEVQYSGKEVQQVLAAEVKLWAEELAKHLDETDQAKARKRALATISLLAGGLSLARALGECELSEEILSACRERILDNAV